MEPKSHIAAEHYDAIIQQSDFDGPAEEQITNQSTENNITIEEIGILSLKSPIIANDTDQEIANILEKVAKDSNKIDSINWPTISKDPINEYSTNCHLFSMAFPWLFPGGFGDFCAEREKRISAQEWGQQLLYYMDGRFATDKIFSFFALNFIVRRRNQEQGRFFINDFSKDCPKSIDEMKEMISEGKSKFIDQVQYFSQNVIGSTSYWYNKKCELQTWISHHVEQGHGPPQFFITLSCAEYHWADIKKLIKERNKYCTEMHIEENITNIVEMVNKYSIVVQEYFQIRVETFLNTIGKEILGIKHYWVRYEFAPSRGQIHAHLLAICPESPILQNYWNLRGKEKEQAEMIAKWAQDVFGMTAEIEEVVEEFDIHPCSLRFSEVQDEQKDLNSLLSCVQMHKCNGYCMPDKVLQN